jgi:hypothetical protein
MSLKLCCRLRQSLALKATKVVRGGFGRVLQAHAMVFRSLHDQPGCETQEIKDEIVWMLSLYTELSERFRRKIGKVTLRRFRRVTHLYLAEVIQGRNSIGRGRDI